MATLATQSITRAGLANAFVAAAGGGDSFTPGDRTFVEIKNASGSPITVTFVTPPSVISDVPITDITVSIPATTGERKIGPFPGSYFANPTTGLVDMTYSGVTSLTVGVFAIS